MPGVYSVRFACFGGAGHYLDYVVPAGKRAVVASIDGTNAAADTGRVYAQINGITWLNVNLPGNLTNAHWEGRATVYAGETLRIGTLGTSSSCQVSGYLLDDPGTLAAGSKPTPPIELGPAPKDDLESAA